jgi:hypothetical protein
MVRPFPSYIVQFQLYILNIEKAGPIWDRSFIYISRRWSEAEMFNVSKSIHSARRDHIVVGGGNSKKENPQKGDKARFVGGWAKATECVAKALMAVVGLVTFILWKIEK